MKFKFCLLLAALALTACSGNRMVVVQSPPTNDVAFTVIPAAYAANEIEFAGAVESRLLPFVHVLERPPFKFMSSDKQRTQSDAARGVGTSETESVKVTDVVAMYPDSKATYIVTSYASTRRIRIVERVSNALIAAVDLPSDDPTNDPHAFENSIYSTLVYAKILPNGFSAQECKIMDRQTPQSLGVSCPEGQVFDKTAGKCAKHSLF